MAQRAQSLLTDPIGIPTPIKGGGVTTRATQPHLCAYHQERVGFEFHTHPS